MSYEATPESCPLIDKEQKTGQDAASDSLLGAQEVEGFGHCEMPAQTDQDVLWVEKEVKSATVMGNIAEEDTTLQASTGPVLETGEGDKEIGIIPEEKINPEELKKDESEPEDSKTEKCKNSTEKLDTSALKISNEQKPKNLELNVEENKNSDTDSEYCDCRSQVSESLDKKLENSNPASTEEEEKSTDGSDGKVKSPSNSSINSFPTQTTLTTFCRICHCEGDSELGPLIAPCYCRGSLQYVHQACLQQWIKSSDTKHCELCGYHFVMDSKLKPFHKWKKLSMSTSERRKILCSVMFHIVAITCVIWSLYVLIERTASEIKEGKLQWPFWTKLVVVAIGFTGGLVFMYVQCKVYVQLWKRLKAFNRVIYVKNNPPTQAVTTDDDTIADAGSIASDVEHGNQRSVTTSRQSSAARDDVIVVEMSCRDGNN